MLHGKVYTCFLLYQPNWYLSTAHLYCYSQLQPCMISNDFHWLRSDEELYFRDEGWCSCVRRSVLSPCMLSTDYYCVVSVTVGDQSVRTLIKTLIISKYFVGSGANPVHTHVVVKSLVRRYQMGSMLIRKPGGD